MDRFVIGQAGSTDADKEVPPSRGLSVYPNPASRRAFVRYEAPVGVEHIEVYDALGRRVYRTERSVSVQAIALGGLVPGTYVVRVVREGRTVAQTRLAVGR